MNWTLLFEIFMDFLYDFPLISALFDTTGLCSLSDELSEQINYPQLGQAKL